MDGKKLIRTYLVRGLDRILYARQPAWLEGTFEQTVEDEGRLVLVDHIFDASEIPPAVRAMDMQAERFRLAVSLRTGCPLTLKLERSEEPRFDPSGVASVSSTVLVGDAVECAVRPRDPPGEMEQLSESAARWVQTIAEVKKFAGHPDESLKRLHLLIEELSEVHSNRLSEEQLKQLPEIKWVRNFVSHAYCRDPDLCAFIARRLPSAVINGQPLVVQFDRTQLEHMNFVGRYDPMARSIVNRLLDAAVSAISP